MSKTTLEDYIMLPKGAKVDLALKIEEDDSIRRRLYLSVTNGSNFKIPLRAVGDYKSGDGRLNTSLALVRRLLNVEKESQIIYALLSEEQSAKYSNDGFIYHGSDIAITLRRMAFFVDLVKAKHPVGKLGTNGFNHNLYESLKLYLLSDFEPMRYQGYRISDSYKVALR